jgi:hypothetical protein
MVIPEKFLVFIRVVVLVGLFLKSFDTLLYMPLSRTYKCCLAVVGTLIYCALLWWAIPYP